MSSLGPAVPESPCAPTRTPSGAAPLGFAAAPPPGAEGLTHWPLVTGSTASPSVRLRVALGGTSMSRVRTKRSLRSSEGGNRGC